MGEGYELGEVVDLKAAGKSGAAAKQKRGSRRRKARGEKN